MAVSIQEPFWWVPYWERKWAVYATTFTEEVWRVEARANGYMHHAFHQHPWDIFDLCFFEEDWKQMAGDFLKRAIEAAAQGAGAVHFRDEQLEREYPALYDYLACAVGPNAKPREGACLLVYARDGEVTCCVKDRGLKKAFYGRSDGFWEALKDLEAKLRTV